jgi:hypothetical protein
MDDNTIEISLPKYTQMIQKELAYDAIVSATSDLLYSKDTGELTEYERIMNWFINTMVDLEV